MARRQTDHALQARPDAPRCSRTRGAVVAYAVAVALGCWVQAGSAQTLKKYVTPDGKIIYSDKPIPDAKLIGEVLSPPPPDPAAVEAARAREVARGAEANRVAEERLKAQEAERKRIDEATANVERARRMLDEGRAPKPGERIGTAGGGTRFTEDYLERQRANEEAVKRAEEELNKARGR